MLYIALKAQVMKYGLTIELAEKIDIFYATGKITLDQYKSLINM